MDKAPNKVFSTLKSRAGLKITKDRIFQKGFRSYLANSAAYGWLSFGPL